MRCARNIHWLEKWEKMNCIDEEDNGKGKRYLFCEASNVLFGKYKTKSTYIHISEDVATLLGIGI